MGIGRAEALDSLRSDDLIGIGMEADAVRRRLHPEGVVGYAAVSRLECAGGSVESLSEAAEEMLARGGSGVSLAGAVRLGLGELGRLVGEIRRRSPAVWIAALRAGEMVELAASSGLPVADVVGRLRDEGLSSLGQDAPAVSGGGTEVAEWLEVHEAAHRAGMRTAATLRLGAGETMEARVGFLEAAGALHERTGGFRALAVESAGGGLAGPTAVECLKTLAVSRLMLDGVENMEAGRLASGLKVLEMALRFGANDAGEIALELYGAAQTSDEEDLRRVIRDAGFMPVERDPGYRMMFVA